MCANWSSKIFISCSTSIKQLLYGDKKLEFCTKPSIHLAIYPSDNLSIKIFIHTVIYPNIHHVFQTSIRIVSHLSNHPSNHEAIHNPSIQPAINQTILLSRHSSYNASISNISSYPTFNQFITQPSYFTASHPYFYPTLCPFEHQAIQPEIQLAIYRLTVYPALDRFNDKHYANYPTIYPSLRTFIARFSHSSSPFDRI